MLSFLLSTAALKAKPAAFTRWICGLFAGKDKGGRRCSAACRDRESLLRLASKINQCRFSERKSLLFHRIVESQRKRDSCLVHIWNDFLYAWWKVVSREVGFLLSCYLGLATESSLL